MEKIIKEELKDVLYKHRMWLRGDDRGERANLQYADLRDADLRLADLRDADLRDADLRVVNLRLADLRGADLRGADLRDADLSSADLRGAGLRNADLRGANLQNADFQYSNLQNAALQYAYMQYANLQDTDLRNAELQNTDLRNANMKHIKINYNTTGIHPAPEGELIGWGKKNGVIVKLLIPAEAKRSCATSRKYRAEYAEVLEVEGQDKVTVKNDYGITVYKPGETVRCHKWDSNRWNECGGGIHFFLTREEAESF